MSGATVGPDSDSGAIEEFRQEVVRYLLEQFEEVAVEAYGSNRGLVEEMLKLHECNHAYAESFPELKWFVKACRELSTGIFLALIGLYYPASFVLRHGLDLVNKNTKGGELLDSDRKLFNAVYGRLSEVLHAQKDAGGLEEFRDRAVAVSYLYLRYLTTWNPNLTKMLLQSPEMEDDLEGSGTSKPSSKKLLTNGTLE
jgi:hypothetical protein